jgi:hypothetical protein
VTKLLAIDATSTPLLLLDRLISESAHKNGLTAQLGWRKDSRNNS